MLGEVATVPRGPHQTETGTDPVHGHRFPDLQAPSDGSRTSPGRLPGDFTSELDEGDYINEFAAAGPKNYGYVTKDGKVCCKVRGFSLNTRGSEQLNFDTLKRNVMDELKNPLEKPREVQVFNPHKIVRDNKTKKLETSTEIKRYRVVFDKRVVDTETFFSYP